MKTRMQVLVFVIGLIGLITVVIGGAIWTIIVMAPTCVLIGLVVFFVVRTIGNEPPSAPTSNATL